MSKQYPYKSATIIGTDHYFEIGKDAVTDIRTEISTTPGFLWLVIMFNEGERKFILSPAALLIERADEAVDAIPAIEVVGKVH